MSHTNLHLYSTDIAQQKREPRTVDFNGFDVSE